MSNFDIRPLNEDELAIWDELVENSPRGTLFHRSFWLKASEMPFVICGYFKGNTLLAGIPLYHYRKFGIRIATHPKLPAYFPYLGPVFKHQDTKYVNKISSEKEISRAIACRLKQESVAIFVTAPGDVDLQPFLWEGFSTNMNYTYIINLSNSLEDIWKSMDDKRRNNIRKAEKDGIIVTHSEDFELCLNLVEKTLKNTECSQLVISPEFTVCNDCHKLGMGIKQQCGYCSSENVYGITRVVGYYSRVGNWISSKKEELKARQKSVHLL